MNCHEFWEREPAPLDHLDECPACALRYARHQQLGAGLRALAAQSREAGAPARLERRLRATFCGEMSVALVPQRGAWVAPMAWGAAMAATLLAGFVLMQGRQPQSIRHLNRNQIEVAAVEAIADPMASLADGYGEFIPLPNAEGIAPNEQVNLVRVEVPRSSMIPLGYAVSEENASEIVEADVVLGADGVARAIRFRGESMGF